MLDRSSSLGASLSSSGAFVTRRPIVPQQPADLMILRPAGGAIPPQGPPPGLLEPEKAAGDNLQTSHYDGPMPTTPRSALVLALGLTFARRSRKRGGRA